MTAFTADAAIRENILRLARSHGHLPLHNQCGVSLTVLSSGSRSRLSLLLRLLSRDRQRACGSIRRSHFPWSHFHLSRKNSIGTFPTSHVVVVSRSAASGENGTTDLNVLARGPRRMPTTIFLQAALNGDRIHPEAPREVPDLVTANQGEPGIVELCELLLSRGVGDRGWI